MRHSKTTMDTFCTGLYTFPLPLPLPELMLEQLFSVCMAEVIWCSISFGFNSKINQYYELFHACCHMQANDRT